MKGYGPTVQKILLLLLGGAALSFSYSPSRCRRIWHMVQSEWRLIERAQLTRTIQRLYESKLIEYRENGDGTVSLVLLNAGQRIALRYHSETMTIPNPKIWDKKWRIILFDIPETKKRLRDTLRTQLKKLGLLELQKSVFVHPYACHNEIDFLIELYQARHYVRFVEATHIDNELHLKRKFELRGISI